MKKIIAMHSGTQHSYQIALALQEANMLEKYITSIYYKKNTAIYNYLESMSHSHLHQFLSRKNADYLNDELIQTVPQYEIIENLAKRLLKNSSFTNMSLPHWRDRNFDHAVSKMSTLENAKGVISFPNCSLKTFKAIKKISTTNQCVIEQPIGYYKEAETILLEEMELHPEFADTITYIKQSQVFKDRIDEELSLADNIFVASSFVKNTLEKHGIKKEKILLNPYGSFIPTSKSIPRNNSEKLKVIFVGQLSQRKGLKYLLESVKLLKENGYKVHLTLVGKIYGTGKWMTNYTSTIDQYISHTSREKLKKIYAGSDIFVLPSLFEGSALVVYEALASGLPAIVSVNTGSDMINDFYNGFTVPIRSIESISEKLSYLINNPDILDQMKKNCIVDSESMSWSHYRTKIQSLFSDD